ncbi:MAG: thioester reductase domain-containing protein [Candidatus Tectimicrobiota bacterium]
MHSILDDLDLWAADIPENPLYTFLDGAGQVLEAYTYRQFHARSQAVAAALHRTGHIGYGARVLLVYPPGLEVAVAFMACVHLGALPVPVPPPDAAGFVGGVEKLAYVAQDAGAAAVLTTQQYRQHFDALAARSQEAAPYLQGAALARLPWLETDQWQDALPEVPRCVNPWLFLQYTSGSTQRPRGVMVAHSNVLHNCHATLDHRPVGVSWLPHYHDMGLIGYYLFIMLTGGSVTSFSAFNFLKRPLLWLETLSKVRATITSAPNFAFEYCLREDKVPSASLAGLDLRSVRCLMNASEPVRAQTYTRFLRKFAPCGLSPQAAVVFYGLAENTLSVTGYGRVQVTANAHLLERNKLRLEAPRTDGVGQRSLMSCGKPLQGMEVRIVDGNTRLALGEDAIGEIWLGGPSKTAGYWHKPVLNQERFEAVIQGEDTQETYLRTGDLGFLHEGELFVCGRLKDMMIIGGRNYYPTDIEAVVEQSTPTVRQGCVAAFAVEGEEGEEIVVLAEAHRANALPDLERLCQDIRQRCQVDVAVCAIVPHGSIAKTSSGKTARQQCKQRWQAGEITPLGCWRRPATPQSDAWLEALLRRLDGAGRADCTLADLGVDSLTLVQLSLHLEQLCTSQGAGLHRDSLTDLFDLRVLQAVTVGELRAFFAAVEADTQVLQDAPQVYRQRLHDIEQTELQHMQRDALLPDDIVPRGRPRAGGRRVLLTGATGFVGAFLLEALLRCTPCEVVTLVRAADEAHARTRVAAALQRTGLWDTTLQAAFDTRVVALPGELAQPQLGLRNAQWQELSRNLSALYHCAAEVDYVKPYHQLRDANVVGTLNLLRLASSGRHKALHVVSTTFIFGFAPRRILWEQDANAEMAGLNFGYAQSKWVAEQLVLSAAQRGLDVHLYRPSLITASRQGRYVRRDITARLLAYMISHGLSVNAHNQVSLLPVDVCANNIVALSLLDVPMPHAVHLTADTYYTMQDVCTVIQQQFGYPFRYTSLEGFVAHMNAHCTEDEPLFPLMAFLNHNVQRLHAMRHKRYDNQQYRLLRAKTPLTEAEPPLADTVRGIVEFLSQERLIPQPPRHSALWQPILRAQGA